MISFSHLLLEELYPLPKEPENKKKNVLKYALGGLGLAALSAGIGTGGYYLYNQHRWNNKMDELINAERYDMRNKYDRAELHAMKHAANKLKEEYAWKNPYDEESMRRTIVEDPERYKKFAYETIRTYNPPDKTIKQSFEYDNDDGKLVYRIKYD